MRSARLELYATKRSNSAALTISAYRVLRAWVGKQATWAQASTGVPWSLAGCNGQGVDREAAATNTFLADAASRWYSLDVTALARAWAADPAQNQGLVLKGSGGTSVEYNLASKESADASLRPRLVVQLVLGPATTATPSPIPNADSNGLAHRLGHVHEHPSPDGFAHADPYSAAYEHGHLSHRSDSHTYVAAQSGAFLHAVATCGTSGLLSDQRHPHQQLVSLYQL